MLRMGPPPGEIRSMTVSDIFGSRLKLLIIMVKAYLKRCPMGTYRKKAIIENARNVFYHSLRAASETAASGNLHLKTRAGVDLTDDLHEEHLFHQRVQLLAVMATAVAEGRPSGHFREKALKDNLDRICEVLIFNFNVNHVKFLKVA